MENLWAKPPLFIDALRQPTMDQGKIIQLYSILGHIV
jgi:hypothetical protein